MGQRCYVYIQAPDPGVIKQSSRDIQWSHGNRGQHLGRRWVFCQRGSSHQDNAHVQRQSRQLHAYLHGHGIEQRGAHHRIDFLPGHQRRKCFFGHGEPVAGAPVLSFLNSDNPATGNSALSPVIADFNGDGFADVAIANNSDSTISIELGKGDGTFTAPPTGPVAAGQTPTSLAAGDFNNDGIPDLVTTNVFGGYVTVLLGNGDGSFTPARNSPISSSIQPSAVAVGDFNGDGIADVVIGDSAASVTGPSSMSVLLGKGDGTFATRRKAR